MPGNLANLQKATTARTAAATAPAEAALTAMIKAGEPVTFRGLAARAGVSLDFLYRNTAIRTRIEHHRSAQPPRPQPAPAALPGQDLSASVVRTLTAQLAELETPPPRGNHHPAPGPRTGARRKPPPAAAARGRTRPGSRAMR